MISVGWGSVRIDCSPLVNNTELRYKYCGSYRDPDRYHFGFGPWLNEEECRAALAAALRNAEIADESLRVVVEQKKRRWLAFKNGTVVAIFPDLIVNLERERAVAEVIENGSIAAGVRFAVANVVKKGNIEEALAHAELLASALRQALAARDMPAGQLLARWDARVAVTSNNARRP